MLALADRSPLRGGGWSADDACDRAGATGARGLIAETLDTLERHAVPAPREWIGDRLTVLWADFMASRPSDPSGLTVWLVERIRLLSDLPHDILAHSIDMAIKTSAHGFIPSIGEIRAIADPLAAERREQIGRLHRMARLIANPSPEHEQ